jgi:bacterial/archaeal transporter family-2 protein
MTVTYWPYLLAVVVGVALTIQTGMNMTLGRVLESPLAATTLNFAIGLGVLVACLLAAPSRPNWSAAPHVPAWAWLGGALGAGYVMAVTVLGPRIGALATFTLGLAGQLAAALLVDRYGLLGFPRADVTPMRLAGLALVVMGALLALRR